MAGDEADVKTWMRALPWALIASLAIACSAVSREPQKAPAGKTRTSQTARPARTEAVMPAAGPAEPVALPPQPVAPDYDLPSDRERIATRMQQDLGARSKVVVVSDLYLVGAPAGSGVVEEAVPFVEQVLEALHNNRFKARPPRALAVYLFPEAGSYERFCKAQFGSPCISRFGFFSPSAGALIMNIGLGMGTLSHELVHPILAADFPQAPTWINEGIASLYEAPVLPRRGEIHGRKNWRHPRLIAALTSPQERTDAALHNLFRLSDQDFRGDKEDLHYSMARYACQWLDGHGHLWAFYHAWRDGYADDPTGEKAFESVTGKSPAQADREWSRWVQSL